MDTLPLVGKFTNITLEKEYKNSFVETLRIILIYETNLNLNNKIIGKRYLDQE